MRINFSISFFSAIALERAISSRIFRVLKNLAAIFALAFFATYFWIGGSEATLGATLIAVSFFFTFSLFLRFIEYHKKQRFILLPETLGSAEEEAERISHWRDFCDFESLLIIAEAKPLSLASLGFSLCKSPFGAFFLERTGIARQIFLETLSDAAPLNETRFAEIILREAINARHPAIHPTDILATLTHLSDSFKKTILGASIEPRDFTMLAAWYETKKEHARYRSLLEIFYTSPGIGKTWAFAYTPLLDRFARELNIQEGKEYLHITAHNKEITLLTDALSKSESANAILVGNPGIGKTTIIRGLGKRMREGKSSGNLNYKRLTLIDMNAVVSEKSFGDLAAILTTLLRQADAAGNVILAIDNIEQYLVPGSPVNVAEILLPFLKSSRINIIGTATRGGYEKNISQNALMRSLFEAVPVEEPDRETMLAILGDIALHHEKKYGVRIQYQALKKIYDYAASFSSDIPFPESGLNALEEVFADATHGSIINEKEAANILGEKKGIPLGMPEQQEKSVLLSLETELGKLVVGQHGALAALANALRRARAGVETGEKPLGTFLFLGPTGVGKTETAKTLAALYFGSEERFSRFDMSEYQNSQDLERLIGSQTSGIAGVLTSAAHAKPFSLMLFDEIEKAHQNVLNLFLQILDEGRLTDAFGKTASFKNTILIATSNAGAEFIRETLSKDAPYEALQKGLADFVLRQGVFRPEFLNRFDAVLVFKPLSREEARDIVRLMLDALGRRLKEQGYEYEITAETIAACATKGYSETFGARELRRVIQNEVESRIAREILEEKYRKGDAIRI